MFGVQPAAIVLFKHLLLAARKSTQSTEFSHINPRCYLAVYMLSAEIVFLQILVAEGAILLFNKRV